MEARYFRIPPALVRITEREMTEAEVILALREVFPPVSCRWGCTDCCGPVPFSRWEWTQVPPEKKNGLTVKMIPVHHPRHGFSASAIIPFAGDVPQDAFLECMTPGAVMRLGTKLKRPELVTCPFAREGRCTIHEHRPILCRLYGAVDDPRVLCSYGVRAVPLLPAFIGQTAMAIWFQILPAHKGKKNREVRL